MIAYGNNIYRTLDQKIYIGANQIAKVYKGTELIYPEDKIIIDDIEIDVSPYYLNGNMYDTGYKPTKNTRFEICFTAQTDNTNAIEFFGTHHDNGYYAQYTYKLADDGVSRGEVVNSSGGYTNDSRFSYKNKTKFHLILRDDNILSFRYGGDQGQSSGENIIITKPENNKIYFACFDDDDKIYVAKDYGPYYYKSKGETKTFGNKTNVKMLYSNYDNGGNLWINAINSKIISPNGPYNNNDRKQYNCPTIENNKLKFDDTSTDIEYYHATSNSAFHYLILWEKGNEATKVMFKQAKLQIDQTHSIYVFEKHESELRSDNKYHFKSEIAETIYPFYYCNPNIHSNS